ncbi:MAG: serine/threonine protein kinase [Sandaracinaceae bacterium]|nr:serine/threonine protein kinase [Sandaracinaceae bacterium]
MSLAELLARRGRTGLALPLACRVIAEVAAALDYAHRLTDGAGVPLGVVHRDVSPGNVMIARDGTVKLVDFGLAKARTQIMKTQPGLVKGKFGYLAPEQIRGQVDYRTDLFALGLCFYEAVTGTAFFGQATAAQTVAAIRDLREAPRVAALLGAPAELDGVLAKALAPAPEARFESAAAFRAPRSGGSCSRRGHGAVSAEQLAAEVARARGGPPSAPPPRLALPS